jgi:hypothetical protein
VVGSQIENLILDLSFSYNLCFKYPNGSCELIINIYVSRSFQWYKEIFNPMNFNPWNCPLKIQESIGTLTFKVRAHLQLCGFIPSHFLTLPGAWNVTPRFHSWFAPLQAITLIANPKLGLQQITWQIFLVHAHSLIDGYWIKVHENDFNRATLIMKNSCIEATQILI